jgi:hypothetical protein
MALTRLLAKAALAAVYSSFIAAENARMDDVMT